MRLGDRRARPDGRLARAGGARARAARRGRSARPRPGRARAALERGCVEEAGDDLRPGLRGRRPRRRLRAGRAARRPPSRRARGGAGARTVTDIGSTKAQPRARPRAARTAAASSAATRSAAPRRAGAEHASAEIFDGATWFLTPVADTDPARYARLHGARDRRSARCPWPSTPARTTASWRSPSHLPHVLANLLATQAGAGRSTATTRWRRSAARSAT